MVRDAASGHKFVDLLDFEPELAALKRQSNPFALVTAAHLSALRTRRHMGRRGDGQLS